MNTQTSLVASHFRLQQWAEQIKECQSRPAGMNVDTWCAQNGITKANYYYRLRRVREACLSAAESNGASFVEMPVPVDPEPGHPVAAKPVLPTDTVAVLRCTNGLSIEIRPGASAELIHTLIGALAHVK
jgi:hypothetical protein